MSGFFTNQADHLSHLKVHEWLAVAFLIGIVAALTVITSYNPHQSIFDRNIPKDGIEVVVKGAVAHPGVYRFPFSLPMKEILEMAGVESSADLKRFKPDQVVKKGRILNIPTRQMITVYVKGAVKENVVLNVPKGIKLEQLIEKVVLAENADKKFLQKKRRLKDQEVIVIPSQKAIKM